MPAYFDTGFSVRQPSWHGEETLLDEYPESWDEARRAAGLMWEPISVPAFGLQELTMADIMALAPEAKHLIAGIDYGAKPNPDAVYPIIVAEANYQRIVRDDTNATLAIPTDSYSLITHADMGHIIEAALQADTNVRFETAGSVRDGKQVWALVRLDEPYQVPGDDSPTYPFMAMLNAHDGSASCSLTFTDIRVVCWNTWSAADAQGERFGTRYVLRHTGDVQARIAEARKAFSSLRAESDATRQLFTELAGMPVRPDQVKTFTELFLPSPRDTGEVCTDRVQANVDQARATFDRLYTQGLTTDGIRESAYGLLMASTEYLDHIRGFRTRDSYVGRTILTPERAKLAALRMIREVVAA